MPSKLELTAEIVSSHVSNNPMSSEDLLQEINKVFSTLRSLESGTAASAEQTKPAISVKGSFKKNEVICLLCGKGGMKTLARHLNLAHGMKPGEYRKLFGIPVNQPLTATIYSAARKKMAVERGLGQNLVKARKAHQVEKLKAHKTIAPKAGKSAPAVKTAPAKKAAPVKAPVKTGKSPSKAKAVQKAIG